MWKKFLLVFAVVLIINFGANIVVAESENLVKAYRSINFGDSKEIVIQKIADDPCIISQNYGDGQYAKVVIGDYNFDLSFSYCYNQLCRVAFRGDERDAEYFDKITKVERDLLVQVTSQNYESPSISRDIDLCDLNNGFVTWSHIWSEEQVGEAREIKIGIGKSDKQFYTEMHIYYLPLIGEILDEVETIVNKIKKLF